MPRRKTESQAKTRSDSILRSLPEERQLEIFDDLKEKSAAKVKASLAEEGITIGLTALYNFAAYWRSRLQFIEAQGQQDSLLFQMALKAPPVKMARLEAWADAHFMQQTVATGDVAAYAKLRTITERAKQTRMDERRLAMLEQKSAKLAAVEQALKTKREAGGLTPETLEQMEALLGMIQN